MRPLDSLRRLGPHPILLLRYVVHQARFLAHRRSLHRRYSSLVIDGLPEARLVPPSVRLTHFDDLAPPLKEAAERLRATADAALAHEFDLLGSGPTQLGRNIDWHCDFKSGYRWPAIFYLDLEVTRLDDGSDAKVAWELSRGHQLLALARAAVVFDDEQYAKELEAQLLDWIERNPPGVGIAWANAMETGVRAVNWLWAIGTLEQRWRLAPTTRAAVTRALQSHGRHIEQNLEGTPYLRSNHYLADVLGLFALGVSLDGDPAAARWLRKAHRALEQEIVRQVLPDGVGFEASLSYHGLSLEMFLVAYHLAALNGIGFSRRFEARLIGMLAAAEAVRHDDGRLPLFGDGDAGRILPGGVDRPPTLDPVLWLGAALTGRRGPHGGSPDPEVAWNLGLDAWARVIGQLRGTRSSAALPSGGLYVLRGGGTHAVVRCGGVGQNGNGGHGHCDLLSFELSIDGVPFVVDSGTYAYTFDPDARNEFRSTRAHNTVVVGDLDQHEIDPRQLFRMRARGKPRVRSWIAEQTRTYLSAEHDAYMKPFGVMHRRNFTLDHVTGRLSIVDELAGKPVPAQAYLHFASGVRVELEEEAATIGRNGVVCVLEFSGTEAPTLVESYVSDSYGVRELTPTLVLRPLAATPMRLSVDVVPFRALAPEAALVRCGAAR